MEIGGYLEAEPYEYCRSYLRRNILIRIKRTG